MYDDTLLWKFLSYFSQNAGGRTWTAKLPLLISAKNARAMKAAARAVSLAFAAQNVRDPSMAQAACEYYGNSLRYHQFSFKAPPGKDPCKKKAVNALPVTVLLSYFEMIQSTSPDAWLKHTLAADRLFALLGTDALSDDLLNHLYFIIRSNSTIRCFLLGTQTQLAEQHWSEIALVRPCGRATAVFHDVVDIIMRLSRYINVHNLDSPLDLSRHHRATLEATQAELSALWTTFGGTIGLDVNIWPLFDSIVPSEHQQTYLRSFLPDAIQESSAALSAAFFHAAAILVLTLLHRNEMGNTRHGITGITGLQDDHSLITVSSNSQSLYLAHLEHHGAQIIALAQCLRTQQIGCACLRMILPLTVVHRLSPLEEQSLLAETSYRDWCISDGMPGLVLLAFGDKQDLTTMSIPGLQGDWP